MNADLAEGDLVAEEMAASEIGSGYAPIPREDVTAVVLDHEAVVLTEGASEAYYLDELATLVWNTFDGSSTLDELAADFAEAFGAPLETVSADIVELTRQVGRAGLLEGIAFEPPPEPSFAFPTGVSVGEPIPAFRLPDRVGTEVALANLAGRSVVLVNWSPRCGFCEMIAPDLAELQPGLAAGGFELVFITLGDEDENDLLLSEHGLRPRVLYGEGRDVEAFAGVGTPAAYLVDADGLAASALTVGADKVPDLIRSIAGRSDAPPP